MDERVVGSESGGEGCEGSWKGEMKARSATGEGLEARTWVLSQEEEGASKGQHDSNSRNSPAGFPAIPPAIPATVAAPSICHVEAFCPASKKEANRVGQDEPHEGKGGKEGEG